MSKFKQSLKLGLVLAKTEFKLRNEGSYLGIFWYLLNPLLMFLLLLVVFANRLGQDITNYPGYLLLGITIFNFFQQATIESTRIIYEYKWFIKSVNFPHESLVIAIILKTFFSHIFEIFIFAAVIPFFGISIIGIIFYPLILIFLCLFISGVSFTLSALTAYFIDLENVWLFATRLLWLATPIFYSTGNGAKIFILNQFNPIYYFVTAARSIIIYSDTPESWIMLGILGWTFISLATGLIIFNKLKDKFAELI